MFLYATISVVLEFIFFLYFLLFKRAEAERPLGYIVAAVGFSLGMLTLLNYVESFDLDFVSQAAQKYVEGVKAANELAGWASLFLGLIETAAWIASVLSPLAIKVAVLAGIAQSVTNAAVQLTGLCISLGLLFYYLAEIGKLVVPPLLVCACAAIPLRGVRKVGLVLAGVVVFFALVLPLAASPLIKVKVEGLEKAVPEDWGAALIEVVDARGDPLPYALVFLEADYNFSRTECCCCRIFNLTPDTTARFTVQMNQFGRRLVLLPWGEYKVTGVVFYWFNFTFTPVKFAVEGYGRLVVPEVIFPVNLGPTVSDGILTWEGDCARVKVFVEAPVYDMWNWSGVYGFSYGFLDGTPIPPATLTSNYTVYRETLYPWDNLTIWTYGPARIVVRGSCINATLRYRVRAPLTEPYPYGIYRAERSAFREIYKKYRDWWYRTKAPHILEPPEDVRELFDELPGEMKKVVRELNRTRPDRFTFKSPPVRVVEVWVEAEEEDWEEEHYLPHCTVEVWIISQETEPWNFTPWLYSNDYLSYYKYYLEYSEGPIAALSKAYPLAIEGLYTLLTGALGIAFVVAALGAPSLFFFREFYRVGYYMFEHGWSALSRPLRRVTYYLLWRLSKMKKQFLRRELARLGVYRAYEELPLKERVETWRKILECRTGRIKALLAALGIVAMEEVQFYRSRALPLALKLTGRERLKTLAEHLEKWPYHTRRAILRKVGAAVFGLASRAYGEVMLRRMLRGEVVSGVAAELARSLASEKAVFGLDRMGVQPCELLRSYLAGKEKAFEISRYLLVSEGVRPEVLKLPPEALTAYTSFLYGYRVPPEMAVNLAPSLPGSYEKALSYLNLVAWSEWLRNGEIPREVREILTLGREELVLKTAELARRHLEVGWTPYYASVLSKEDLELLPYLYLNVKRGLADYGEAVLLARGFADFLLTLDPETYEFLRGLEGEALILAAAALASREVPEMEVAELGLKEEVSDEDYEAALSWLNRRVFSDVYETGASGFEYLYEIGDKEEFVRNVSSVASIMFFISELDRIERVVTATLLREAHENTEQLLEEAVVYMVEAEETGDPELLLACSKKLREAARSLEDVIPRLKGRVRAEVERAVAELSEVASEIERYAKKWLETEEGE